MNKGDKVTLNKAKVLNIKDDYDYYNGRPRWNRRILAEDPSIGRVWFKTAAAFSETVYPNNLLSCELTISGFGDGIVFGKSPKNALVEAEVV